MTHSNSIHEPSSAPPWPSITTTSTSTRRTTAKSEETWLFFASAVGSTVGWTAVLSQLVYYTDTLGVDSYLVLNLCIYAPLFPITLAQSLWDADFDRHFTSLRSFWVRGSVSYALMVIACLTMAYASQHHSLLGVAFLALMLGTASGILHGALKQMAAFVYPGCGKLAAAVTAGLQASALLVLIITVMTHPFQHSTASSSEWLYIFYGLIAGTVALTWYAFQRLMTHSQDVYRSMMRRDSSIQLSAMQSSILLDEDGDDDEEEENNPIEQALPFRGDLEETKTSSENDVLQLHPSRSQESTTSTSNDDGDDNHEGLVQPLLSPSFSFGSNNAGNNNHNNHHLHPTVPSLTAMARLSWPLCLALFLTVASSMAVSSWFNRVPGQSPNLPQVLFYTRLFADLMARPATLWLPTGHSVNKTVVWLLCLTLMRLAFVPYFFLYTLPHSVLPQSDALITLGVFGFAGSSGFVVTWVYQLAPRYCRVSSINTNRPNLGSSCCDDNQNNYMQDGVASSSQRQQQEDEEENDALLLQQTNVLNLCFSISVLLGVLCSLSLSLL